MFSLRMEALDEFGTESPPQRLDQRDGIDRGIVVVGRADDPEGQLPLALQAHVDPETDLFGQEDHSGVIHRRDSRCGSLRQPLLERSGDVVRREGGDRLDDVKDRGRLDQIAGGFSAGLVALEIAEAGERVLRRLRHLGHCQRLGIDPGGMTVDRSQNDRRIRPDLIQILLARAGGRKCVVAPAEAADDVGLAQLGAIHLQCVERFVPAVELKVGAPCQGGAQHRVDVPLHEPRQQHLAGEIHNASSRPDEGPHAGVVADIDDVLPPNRDGARPFSAAVDGVDGAIMENDIGGAAARACVGRRRPGERRDTGRSEHRARLQQSTPRRLGIGCRVRLHAQETAKSDPVACDAHASPSLALREHNFQQFQPASKLGKST